jgi:hypothetical protein
MAHTPGPWTAKPEVGRIILNGSSIYGVADITGEFAGWNPDDLLLMAAAPELLQALKTVMCAYGDERSSRWMEELKDKAWDAIDKAEGMGE